MRRALVLAAVLVVLLVGAARAVGVSVHPAIGTAAIVAACVGTALVRRMPPAGSGFAVQVPQAAPPRPLDRRLTQIAWQVRSFDEGSTWTGSMQPHLVELVDERLVRRHGVDRTKDPDRAREILGPELWRLVTEPGRPPRNRKALAAAIERIHAA